MNIARLVAPAALALSVVLPVVSTPAATTSTSSAPLAAAIAKIVNRPSLRHTLFGITVYNTDTKRTIYGLDADKFMKPASTTKTLTEGAVLSTLGGDFRFTTPVYRTGSVDASGTLHGDIVLVASGDPDLSQRIQPDGTLAFENEDHSYDGSASTKAVPGDPLAVLRDLAKQIAASGIKSVTGRVYVDTSIFPDGGAEAGTGAFQSSIVVNDNLIDVTVTPGKSVGDAPSIAVSPQTPYATFASRATTVAAKSDNTLDLEDKTDDFGNRIVTLSGSVPVTDPPTLYAYRVPTPARFAEVALTQALIDAGVSIALPQRDAGFVASAYSADYTPTHLIAKHISPPIREDIRITLKVSDNLHASLMIYALGVYVAHAKHAQLQAGFDVEHRVLAGAGLDLSQATQSDGLGGDAYFTPNFMVSYLVWAQKQPWFPEFYRGLPILGVDGTLFDIQTHAPAKGKVHAKTGTWGIGDLLNHGSMVNAKGLIGYVTTRNGHHIVFALYLNRFQAKHDEDGGHIAGEVLGEIANAIYLNG